jgi:hypothetical protein
MRMMTFACIAFGAAFGPDYSNDAVDWPRDDSHTEVLNAIAGPFADYISKNVPETEYELHVYRSVLHEFETSCPLDDDEKQNALVGRMRAMIEATEAKLVSQQDEIFGAIERHRHAAAAYFTHVDGDAPVDVQRAMSDAFDVLETTTPTTSAGFAAKLRYLSGDTLPLAADTTRVLRILAVDFDRAAA